MCIVYQSKDCKKSYWPRVIEWATYEFMVGKNSFYTAAQNIEIAEKSIAAYLTLFAMNEHNCKMYVEKISDITPELMNDPSTWSGFRVGIQGELIKYDLLNATTGIVTFEDGVLSVSMDKVLSIYENLTGMNLKEKGLDSIQAKMNIQRG